jgi:hypothetical protein
VCPTPSNLGDGAGHLSSDEPRNLKAACCSVRAFFHRHPGFFLLHFLLSLFTRTVDNSLVSLEIIMAFTLFLQFLFAASALGQLPRPAAQCPGYRATNIVQGDSYLTADLLLMGNCSSHSKDVENLRLLVEYQTGKRNQSSAPPCV